ncbi:serine protease [Actinomadura syzygii]|uniref:Serine protease n=1 Tax=Actinomadura syzygii TaxID=1427538 RepID=A0A5D0TUH2_9ACTN|nr:serine protease [Actinomadura syzygii]
MRLGRRLRDHQVGLTGHLDAESDFHSAGRVLDGAQLAGDAFDRRGDPVERVLQRRARLLRHPARAADRPDLLALRRADFDDQPAAAFQWDLQSGHVPQRTPLRPFIVARVQTTVPKRSVARILDADGTPAGAGFPVNDRYVITAAHVVNGAAGVPFESRTRPEGRFRIEFLGRDPLQAEVAVWNPRLDVAVLRLVQPAPPEIRVAPLVDKAAFDERVAMLGFPDGKDRGVWSVGVLRGPQADGWLQVDVEDGSQFTIEGGFSGTPVWHIGRGDVVGMVVAAWSGSRVRSGYVVPTATLLEAWPELREAVRPPSPFRGLMPFDAEHAASFFGRSDEVERITRLVAERPVVTVTGPSGVGKSSIVQAGVAPKVRADGRTAVVVFRPGQGRTPLHALAQALLPGRSQPAERLDQVDTLAAHLERGGMPEFLTTLLAHLDANRLVLAVDQFEEVLNAPEEERGAFAKALAYADRPGSPLALLLTLRADYLAPVLHDPHLAAFVAGDRTITVGELSSAGLRAAITEPIRRTPLVEYEPGLVDTLLRDLGVGPGRLPLLQFTLAQLWDLQSGGLLTHDAYAVIGGVSKGLDRFAERLWGELTPDEQRSAERLLIQLIRPDPDRQEMTRRTAPRDQLAPEQWRVAQRLAVSRLVVLPEDGQSAELVHEALVTHWRRLGEIGGGAREFRLWQEALRQRIALWRRHGRPASRLLSRADLTDALRQERRHPDDLSSDEHAYIRASVRRRWSVRRRLAGAMAVVTGAALIIWIPVSRGLTDNAAQTLLERAKQQQKSDPYGAAHLTLRAYRTRANDDTRRAVHRLYRETVQLTQIIPDTSTGWINLKGQGQTGGDLSGKVSTDGRTLVARSPDNKAMAWHIANGRATPTRLSDEGGTVAGEVTVSADGRYAAATYLASVKDPASGRCVIKASMEAFKTERFCLVVTDMARNKTKMAVLFPQGSQATHLSLDPTGRTLAAAVMTKDQLTLRRWDVGEKKALPPAPLPVTSRDVVSLFRLTPAGLVINFLEFRDGAGGGDQRALGNKLVLISPDGSSRVLEDALTGAKLATSADGRRLAAVVEIDKVTLFDVWDMTTGRMITRLRDAGVAEAVGALAFDPTGTVLHDTWWRLIPPTGSSLKEADEFLKETSVLPVTRWSLADGKRLAPLSVPNAWQTLLPLGGDGFALIDGDQVGLLLSTPGNPASAQLAAMARQTRDLVVSASKTDPGREMAHLCRLYGNMPESNTLKKLVPAGAHKGKVC